MLGRQIKLAKAANTKTPQTSGNKQKRQMRHSWGQTDKDGDLSTPKLELNVPYTYKRLGNTNAPLT